MLVNALEEVRPALAIVDPLVGYMGNRDINKSKDTRPLMYRGQGNLDIIGAARSGLWVQQHPIHPETQSLLMHIKTNVGPLGRTLVFSCAQGEFSWVGVSRLTEAMLTGKGPDPYACLEAFFWLKDYMRPSIGRREQRYQKFHSLSADIFYNKLRRRSSSQISMTMSHTLQ